jgi:hypothetical protein
LKETKAADLKLVNVYKYIGSAVFQSNQYRVHPKYGMLFESATLNVVLKYIIDNIISLLIG